MIMDAKSTSSAKCADTASLSRRVMVVEDEPLIAFDLMAEIEAEGHEVIGHCRSASDAVDMAGRKRPDVVIMDIGLLGDSSGLEAARQIQDEYKIGCVFVSATLDHVDPSQWGNIKPLALIPKPYRDNALTQAIAKTQAA